MITVRRGKGERRFGDPPFCEDQRRLALRHGDEADLRAGAPRDGPVGAPTL